jgi:sulfide:quinone oxidoreductase
MSATTTLILGGGIGGMSAANTLRQLLPSEHGITVVDRSPRYYVGAGKTWVMLGEKTFEQVSRPRSEILAPGIRYLQTVVLGIDLANHAAATESDILRWDHLVIALGADFNLKIIPGLEGEAHTFYTPEGARRLKAVLEHFSSGEIAILIPKVPFQCPPGPYEAAILLAHSFATRGLADKVRISMHTVEGAPMATAGPEMGEYIKSELAGRGIAFHAGKKAVRIDAAVRRMVFEDGSDAPYDLLIVIPPHEAPKPVRDANLTGDSGWIPVDPHTLEAKSADAGGVYAIGDVTAVPLPGRFKKEVPLSLPKAGVFAEAQGRVAAHQIAGKVTGKKPVESFDGRGFCYLELGGRLAVKAEGSFFDLPHPVMQKRSPDEAQFREKLEWVARSLDPGRTYPKE